MLIQIEEDLWVDPVSIIGIRSHEGAPEIMLVTGENLRLTEQVTVEDLVELIRQCWQAAEDGEQE